MTIKITLIDDHALFRSGIRTLLSRQPDPEVVGEASDGLVGVKMVEQLKPDVALLDLDMPVMNGCGALAQILNTNPQLTVIMLTTSEDSDDLAECMRMGAKGFLLKNVNAGFLLESICKAVDGDNVFSPEMTSRLVQSLASPSPSRSDHLLTQLTPCEMEILGYLAAGHSSKIIARHLNLTESTVKVHVQNLLRKLNLSSRVQAAVYAVQHKVSQSELSQKGRLNPKPCCRKVSGKAFTRYNHADL